MLPPNRPERHILFLVRRRPLRLPNIYAGLEGPEDIADAVLFLLSDASSWITVQVIQVAGGHAL
ncbi:SDR family oxidoreductase [Chelativorans sp. SCAU2101]|uniref:SDR family oxidoreductase n=1 Tax=Chelativorans petroleitrophicus TaxID=2975484 RepID=A0A9X3B025_9HYPH|nr:SDR family oxidoreductase [Chelativorans petroleitrophicus]MCT8991130.1 SDR family oxidoreductase [Chelativorans petroleitrophicus]